MLERVSLLQFASASLEGRAPQVENSCATPKTVGKIHYMALVNRILEVGEIVKARCIIHSIAQYGYEKVTCHVNAAFGHSWPQTQSWENFEKRSALFSRNRGELTLKTKQNFRQILSGRTSYNSHRLPPKNIGPVQRRFGIDSICSKRKCFPTKTLQRYKRPLFAMLSGLSHQWLYSVTKFHEIA